jgi:hypothetical protein
MLIRLICSSLLILPLLAQGAITHEETASNSSASVASSGTLTVTMAGAATDGEVLVAICHKDDGAGDQTQSSAPAGWTKATAISSATTDQRDRVVDVWYKVASSEGTSYAFTNNGAAAQEMQCAIVVYSDTNATQLDITPTASHFTFANTNSNAPDPPSITTSTDGAMLLALATLSGNTNTRSCSIITSPDNWTVRHGSSDPVNNAFICIQEFELATAGAYNPDVVDIANGNGCTASPPDSTNCTDDGYAATIAIAPAGAASTDSVLFYTGQ